MSKRIIGDNWWSLLIVFVMATLIITVSCTENNQSATNDGDSEQAEDSEAEGEESLNADREDIWQDPDTGLSWVRTAAPETVSWWKARDYCNELELGGDNWRLPTISELRTLVRNCPKLESGGACQVYDICSSPSCLGWSSSEPNNSCYRCNYNSDEVIEICPAEMKSVCDDATLWSATDVTRNNGKASAWVLKFGDDYPRSIHYSYLESYQKSRAGCVRGTYLDPIAESLEQCEVVEPPTEGDTWVDTASKLMWQHSASEHRTLWEDADEYCDALAIAGHDDWRLPTIDDLRTLVRGCPDVEPTGKCCKSEKACTLPYCNDEGFCHYDPEICDCDVHCYCDLDAGPNDGCYGPKELAGSCREVWSSTSMNPYLGWALNYASANPNVTYWHKCSHVRCVRNVD